MERLRKIAKFATGPAGALGVGALSAAAGVYGGHQEIARVQQVVGDLGFSEKETIALRKELDALIKEKEALGIDRTLRGIGPESWGPRAMHALQQIRKHGGVDNWIKHSQPFLELKIEGLEKGKQALDFQMYMTWYPIVLYGFVKASSGLALALGGPMLIAGRRLRRGDRDAKAKAETEGIERERIVFELFGNAAVARVLLDKWRRKEKLTDEEHATFITGLGRLLDIYKEVSAESPQVLEKLPPDLRRFLDAIAAEEKEGEK